ncbi:hypothetical protein HHUSO_G22910 [Huso huso]|uniref:Uncharacterized protein n=1 Tax=Huso huso TaxID=61971 RepID=A0ABR0YV88_HUSHU
MSGLYCILEVHPHHRVKRHRLVYPHSDFRVDCKAKLWFYLFHANHCFFLARTEWNPYYKNWNPMLYEYLCNNGIFTD